MRVLNDIYLWIPTLITDSCIRLVRFLHLQVSILFICATHFPHIFFSLAALVLKAIPNSKLYIIKNDELPFAELSSFLSYFSAIIVGPGPGSPLNATDVGVVKHLWHVASDLLVPVFGVCLGLQSLAVEHGATLKRLEVVKHGQVSAILHHNSDVFEDIPNGCRAVRYILSMSIWLVRQSWKNSLGQTTPMKMEGW